MAFTPKCSSGQPVLQSYNESISRGMNPYRPPRTRTDAWPEEPTVAEPESLEACIGIRMVNMFRKVRLTDPPFEWETIRTPIIDGAPVHHLAESVSPRRAIVPPPSSPPPPASLGTDIPLAIGTRSSHSISAASNTPQSPQRRRQVKRDVKTWSGTLTRNTSAPLCLLSSSLDLSMIDSLGLLRAETCKNATQESAETDVNAERKGANSRPVSRGMNGRPVSRGAVGSRPVSRAMDSRPVSRAMDSRPSRSLGSSASCGALGDRRNCAVLSPWKAQTMECKRMRNVAGFGWGLRKGAPSRPTAERTDVVCVQNESL